MIKIQVYRSAMNIMDRYIKEKLSRKYLLLNDFDFLVKLVSKRTFSYISSCPTFSSIIHVYMDDMLP